MVSKRQITFESKAQADEKAQHTFEYVSILKRSATQLSDARWGFEITSKIVRTPASDEKIRPVSESSCFLLILAQCYEWNEGRWHGTG